MLGELGLDIKKLKDLRKKWHGRKAKPDWVKKMIALRRKTLVCNVNGSVETGVGNAANLHLAASTGIVALGSVVPVSTPKEKGKQGIAGIYYQDDIIKEAFEFSDGDILVPAKPGLGIELDEDKLKHYRMDM